MTNQHPITPPPELVREWQREANHNEAMFPQVAAMAAQWGADQELEACCEWLASKVMSERKYPELRAARRPKPPSLKEQALQALSEAVKMADDVPPEGICSGQADIIRRALEQLDD